jgi:hypothetical protein
VNSKRILHYIFTLRIYSDSVATDRSLLIRVLTQVLCNKDPLTLTYGVYLAQLFPRNDPFKVLRSNSGRICKDIVRTEAEFLDEIQTKVSRVFLLAIQSQLFSFALSFLFLQTHATSYSFYWTL